MKQKLVAPQRRVKSTEHQGWVEPRGKCTGINSRNPRYDATRVILCASQPIQLSLLL